jgi:anti-anti-sigma regulatory factor
MLKITTTFDSHGSIVLRVEGRLASAWVAELLAACAAVRSQSSSRELDVSGLSFADADGIEALRQLAVQGLRITNRSPFIAELMRENRG